MAHYKQTVLQQDLYLAHFRQILILDELEISGLSETINSLEQHHRYIDNLLCADHRHLSLKAPDLFDVAYLAIKVN